MRRRLLLLVVLAGCSSPPPKARDPVPPGTIGSRLPQSEDMLQSYLDPEHDAWRQPDRVIQTLGDLGLGQGSAVGDIGAGSGYFLDRLSKQVGPTGRVYEVDVDENAVAFLNHRVGQSPPPFRNVEVVKSTPDDVHLRPESLDWALLSEAHFFINALPGTPEHDREALPCLRSLFRAMKPGGKVAVIEFREAPPPDHGILDLASRVHAPFEAVGFSVHTSFDWLDREYFVVFAKPDA